MSPGAAWADRAWEVFRNGRSAGRLALDSVSGAFDLWLAEPADAESGQALLQRLAGAGRVESVLAAGAPAAALLRAAGLAAEREVWQLRKDVRPAQPRPRWSQRARVRSYRERDARAVHSLLERAFAGGGETVPAFARWHRWMTSDEGFDPGSWWLAELDGEVVGAALCWRDGWLKDLAVDPGVRGRGLGEALLRHVFLAFHERGLAGVELKVDARNHTAVRLYLRAGMTVVRVHELFGGRVTPSVRR